MRSFAMNLGDFNGKAGKVEINERGEPTFLPFEPPRQIDLDSRRLALSSLADRKAGELSGAAMFLQNPRIFLSPLVKRESEVSSRLEGTHASLEDVFKAEVDPNEARSQATREVINVANALEFALDNPEIPVLELSKRMHSILFDGIRIDGPKGDFRKRQNFIGPTLRIEDARFIPPMPERIPELMEKFAEFFESSDDLPPLVKAALVHYQFETIHPFGDGNGRIGRALITVFLTRKKVVSEPLLFLSEFFEKHKGEYQDRLLVANKTGDYVPWLEFFLTGVIQQGDSVISRISKLRSLKETYKQRLLKKGSSSKALKVLEGLFINPFVSISYASKKLGMQFPTAQRAIEINLIEIGAVKEITGHKRNRIFCAHEILALINPEMQTESQKSNE